jgi:hypothetical protein
MTVGFLSQMMYALSPTAQDIVAGFICRCETSPKFHNNLPSDRELLTGKVSDEK